MKKTMNTKLAFGMVCSMGLAFGLAGAVQAMPTAHNNITLKDASGNDLTFGSNIAYSTHQTCGACHDYAKIERHATHAQLGANQLSGWNPYNPDSAMPEKVNDTSMGKNWVQSSGHVGKWCPPSARNSARMFGGPAGMAVYNSATGKFSEQNSNNWAPWDFGTEAAFKQKADLTVAGMMQDCGECHVGGGAMEYVPWTFPNMNQRVSLRDIATTPVNGGTPITSANFTTFNYFIDVYDVDGDGNRTEALYNDYTKTGVGEMDCMICHLEGYDGESRISEIRKAKHDTARAVGAGLGFPNAMAWDNATGAPEGYGTQLGGTYAGNSKIDVGEAIPGVSPIKLTANYAASIKKQPPSANCAFCHAGSGFGIGEAGRRVAVDFKKRGDHWVGNKNWDVHSFATGCMDCHARGTALADVGTSGAAYMTGTDANSDGFVDSSGVPVNLTGPDANKLGQCDPSKGPSNFESAWNAKDVAGLSCKGCHTTGDPKKNPLAPDPAAAHAAAGLTATIVQSKMNTSGTADASHLDIMDCAACHIRKLEHYSGSAIIDATGKDPEGRMTDHENEWTERDMYDNLLTIWYQGKLTKANSAITMYWLDKNDVSRDANNDTRNGGMDPLLTSHVHSVNNANGWKSITGDKSGVIAPTDISARQTALSAALDGLLGTTGAAIQPKLTFMGVTFNVDHGVSPAVKAWGAGGCKDCHAPNAGFYNGSYEAKPKELNMTFAADTSQVVPFTMVNSGTQKSSYHPAVMLKKEERSIALDLTSGQSSLRSPDRSEYLYESTFMKPNTAWDADGVITGSAITFPSAAANGADAMGWMMKVQVKDAAAADSTATTHTLQNPTGSATVTNVATLLAAMDGANRANGALAAGSYGFTVTDGGSGNLVLTAAAGKVIRIGSGSGNAAQLGFASALYVADPIVGTLGGSYAGRADWVNYLNGIAVAGPADITTPAGASVTAIKDVAVTFTANTAGNNPGTTYRWDMGNGERQEGPSISYAYPVTGLYKVQLTVIAPSGSDSKTDFVDVKVNATAAPSWTAALNTATTPDQLELVGLPDTTTKVYVVWDDGLKTNQVVAAGTTAVNIPHTYKKVAQRWNGSNFVYNTVVRVYNAGGTLIGTQAVPVTIAP